MYCAAAAHQKPVLLTYAQRTLKPALTAQQLEEISIITVNSNLAQEQSHQRKPVARISTLQILVGFMWQAMSQDFIVMEPAIAYQTNALTIKC